MTTTATVTPMTVVRWLCLLGAIVCFAFDALQSKGVTKMSAFGWTLLAISLLPL